MRSLLLAVGLGGCWIRPCPEAGEILLEDGTFVSVGDDADPFASEGSTLVLDGEDVVLVYESGGREIEVHWTVAERSSD